MMHKAIHRPRWNWLLASRAATRTDTTDYRGTTRGRVAIDTTGYRGTTRGVVTTVRPTSWLRTDAR